MGFRHAKKIEAEKIYIRHNTKIKDEFLIVYYFILCIILEYFVKFMIVFINIRSLKN